MQRLRNVPFVLASAWSIVCLMGCSEVISVAPFGEPIPKGKIAKLSGRWAGIDGDFHFAAGDDGLVLGVLEFSQDTGQFVAVNQRCALTRVGVDDFLFVQTPGNEGFAFALVERYTESEITVRFPDRAMFVALVKSGRVKGVTRVSRRAWGEVEIVTIEPTTDDFQKLIGEKTLATLFPVSSQATFFRNKPPEGPATEAIPRNEGEKQPRVKR